ncbi:Uncharacterized protein Fot_28951 [Forsythia ovata]|uniref:Uncharacterized protein n=1 Tax=Forsythia ovata TaxID=205694 RepID=A0ABD1TQG3_9LAMI
MDPYRQKDRSVVFISLIVSCSGIPGAYLGGLIDGRPSTSSTLTLTTLERTESNKSSSTTFLSTESNKSSKGFWGLHHLHEPKVLNTAKVKLSCAISSLVRSGLRPPGHRLYESCLLTHATITLVAHSDSPQVDRRKN